MSDIVTPGVFIEEAPHFHPAIVSVATAIPAFIGYTQLAQRKQPGDLLGIPWRITSITEYQQYFGTTANEKASLSVAFGGLGMAPTAAADESKRSPFLLFYAMQLFFANGGGPCWIVAAGLHTENNIALQSLKNGLSAVEKVDEVTLLLIPDAMNLSTAADYYALHKQAIDQCARLQDRFTIMDIYHTKNTGWQADIDNARTSMAATTGLKFGAAYFPRLRTSVDFIYRDEDIKITNGAAAAPTLAALKNSNNTAYAAAKNALANLAMLLPASSALAGVYTSVDNARGVWKAPASVNITNAIAPEYPISDAQQEGLNVTADGLSVNPIRSFTGKGAAIVWGYRTMDGNNNEWRYIPVRRFFNMIEKSISIALKGFIFEPNDANTWLMVKAAVSNYLLQQWRSGALMGTTPKEAFFVHAGLNETMTLMDILEGRLIVTIGMAMIRPAEFIIVNITQKMGKTA